MQKNNKPRARDQCEESGAMRDALTRRGWYAMSCDLLETSAPGNHYQGPVEDVLQRGDEWDLMIAHPPCTYLSASGLHWNKRVPGRDALTEDALRFVRYLLDAPVDHIALENPIGCISSRIRPPEQIVQPWMFGDDASKATCFWLKNLPKLTPTNIVPGKYACGCGHRFDESLGKYGCPNCCGCYGATKLVWANQTPSGQNKLGPSPDRAKLRSKTYPGLAEAAAEQWGGHVVQVLEHRAHVAVRRSTSGVAGLDLFA